MLASEMKEIMQEYRRLRAVVPLGSLRKERVRARYYNARRHPG